MPAYHANRGAGSSPETPRTTLRGDSLPGDRIEDYDLDKIIADIDAARDRAVSDGRLADAHDFHVASGVIGVVRDEQRA